MCWKLENWSKVSKEVVSSANNWLILFKHRFGMMLRSKVTINTYFRQNQPHKGPPDPPPTMCWKFENWWKVSKGVLSGEQKSSYGFRNRLRSKKNRKNCVFGYFYTFSIENRPKTNRLISGPLAPIFNGWILVSNLLWVSWTHDKNFREGTFLVFKFVF